MNTPNPPDLLRALREECGRAERVLIGYPAIIEWFITMGFVCRSGRVTQRTLRNWRRFLGLPIGRLPSQGRLVTGKPWTTNFLLAVWCVTRARGLVPSALHVGKRRLWSVEELRAWTAAGAPSRERWAALREDGGPRRV